jgi:hypothetical protein
MRLCGGTIFTSFQFDTLVSRIIGHPGPGWVGMYQRSERSLMPQNYRENLGKINKTES